jgi:rRNA maturation endonuclease Nob1
MSTKKRKPLHRCIGCGVLISAVKKRCGPCADEELSRKRALNVIRRRAARREALRVGAA